MPLLRAIHFLIYPLTISIFGTLNASNFGNFSDKDASLITKEASALLVYHGYRRFKRRGNGIVSRTCSTPESQATVRSKPRPNPECGTEP